MNIATELPAWGSRLLEVATSAPVLMVLLCGGGALGAAALLTPLVIRLAHAQGWVAHPQKDRWHQGRSVALMGGIAIVGAALFGGAVASTVVLDGAPGGAPLSWPIGAAALLLFAVGVADDLYHLSAHAKLLVQVAAAALTLYGGLVFFESGPFWLSGPLTFLWVIGITNAFNLIDGMDGLAGGIGAIAAGTLALIAVHLHLPGLAGAAAAVAGAAGGFLLYNTYPARVFMGDGGSLFLGYALAALAVAVQNGGNGAVHPGAALVPAVVLAVPIFDVVLVTVLRVANGRPITQGGTDHSMHRLAFLGLSERQTVLFLYGISTALGAVALLVYTNAVLFFGALVLAATGALVVLGSYIGGADVYADSEGARSGACRNGGGNAEDENAALRPQTFVEKAGAVMQVLAGRNWKRTSSLLADTFVVLATFMMAHALRFPEGMPSAYQAVMLQALPLVAGAKVAVFYAMGIYHRLWPRAGTPEMVHLGKAVFLTSALTFFGMHVVYGGEVVSAAALVVDALLTGVGVGATRFSFRALRQYIVHKQRTGDRVVICSADAKGILALRSVHLADAGRAFHVVGFLDEETRRHQHHVKGLPVLGSLDKMGAICERERVDGVIVNTASYSDEEIDIISRRCWAHGRDCYRVNLGLDVLRKERTGAEETELEKRRADRFPFEEEHAGGVDLQASDVAGERVLVGQEPQP